MRIVIFRSSCQLCHVVPNIKYSHYWVVASDGKCMWRCWIKRYIRSRTNGCQINNHFSSRSRPFSYIEQSHAPILVRGKKRRGRSGKKNEFHSHTSTIPRPQLMRGWRIQIYIPHISIRVMIWWLLREPAL